MAGLRSSLVCGCILVNSIERTKILLGKGYFPKELPPAFTTADFGRLSEEVLNIWKSSGLFAEKPVKKYRGNHKSRSYTYRLASAEAEIVSAPKRGFERRNLHITHPIPQGALTIEICKNWKTVQKWLAKQAFSLDKTTVSISTFRGIPDINFEAHRAKKLFIESTANWLVKTDITRFYPSIYTHSIAWAAYGKENVKAQLPAYDGSLADRLDTLVRACNRNQTIGIPVGPQTSRIIADVISASIDNTFRSNIPHSHYDQVDRLQDDWFVGCDSLEEADLTLSRIASAYREFGLEINGSKTSIERTSSIAEQQWVSELGSFLAHGTGVPTGKRLSEFLSLGVRMQVACPNQPVTNYLLSIIENSKINISDAATVESFLLRSVTLSPISIPSIARVLINLHHDTKKISVQRVSKRLRQELRRHSDNGNTLEVIWLLYILRGLSTSVRVSDVRPYVNRLSSSAVALVLLDMESRGLLIGSLNKSDWSSEIDSQVCLSSGLWLLAYEGIRHGWLSDPFSLATQPFFKPMLDRNIAFYDPRRNVPLTSVTVKRRRRARARARRVTFALIQGLRGFEVDSTDYD
jgi:hypothetical protein